MVASGSIPRRPAAAPTTKPTPIGAALRPPGTPGAVVHARGIPGRRRAFRVEHRLEAREPLDRRVAARALVRGELAHRDDLVGEEPLVDRLDRALVRAQRPEVLILARDP